MAFRILDQIQVDRLLEILSSNKNLTNSEIDEIVRKCQNKEALEPSLEKFIYAKIKKSTR